MLRPRFSIQGLLVVILVLGLSLGWYLSMRRERKMALQIESLRKSWLVDIPIKDPTKPHFRKLADKTIGGNQWRVYVPSDREYELCFGTGLAIDPDRGKIEVLETMPLGPGYSLIEVLWHVNLARNPSIGWALLDEQKQETRRKLLTIPEEFKKTFLKGNSFGTNYAAPSESAVASPKNTIVFFHTDCTTIFTPDAASPTPARSTELVIWLRPKQPK